MRVKESVVAAALVAVLFGMLFVPLAAAAPAGDVHADVFTYLDEQGNNANPCSVASSPSWDCVSMAQITKSTVAGNSYAVLHAPLNNFYISNFTITNTATFTVLVKANATNTSLATRTAFGLENKAVGFSNKYFVISMSTVVANGYVTCGDNQQSDLPNTKFADWTAVVTISSTGIDCTAWSGNGVSWFHIRSSTCENSGVCSVSGITDAFMSQEVRSGDTWVDYFVVQSGSVAPSIGTFCTVGARGSGTFTNTQVIDGNLQLVSGATSGSWTSDMVNESTFIRDINFTYSGSSAATYVSGLAVLQWPQSAVLWSTSLYFWGGTQFNQHVGHLQVYQWQVRITLAGDGANTVGVSCLGVQTEGPGLAPRADWLIFLIIILALVVIGIAAWVVIRFV